MPDELPADNPFAAMLRGGSSTPAQMELPPDNPFAAMLDPQRAVEQVAAPRYLKNMLAAEQTWDEVAPKLKEHFGVDPKDYEQNYRLGEAHAVQKGEGVGTIEQFMRKSVPGFSELQAIHENKTYREATDRYAAGKGTPEDAATIARYDRLKQIDQQAGPIIGALSGIPKIAGEFYAAGPILRAAGSVPTLAGRIGAGALAATATVPSMTPFREAQERAMRQGGSASDLKNLGPAAAMSVLNAAVLGQVQARFANTQGLFPRALAKGSLGVGEQAAADSIMGLADKVLPEEYQTKTEFGTIGQLLTPGKFTEGLEHATGQFLTFTLFAAAHDRSPANLRRTFKDVLDDFKANGLSPKQAAGYLENLSGRLDTAMQQNPKLTREQARGLFENVPDGALKEHMLARADLLPAANRTPESAPEAPPEAEKPPTQTPAEAEIVAPERSGEVFPDVLKAAGLEGRHEVEASKIAGEGRGEVAVLGYGDRFVSLEHDPKTNSVRIDFDYQDRNAHATPVPKGLGHGSLDIGRDMKRLVVELHDKGLGVNYSADPRRDATYGRMLTEMGYKLESRTVGEKGQVSASWKPDPEAIRSVSELAKAKAKEAQLQKEIADERARQQGSGVVPAPDANPGVPRPAASEVPSPGAGAPVLHPEAKQPAPPAANPSAPANRRQGVRPAESIIAVVKRFGHIDPNSQSFRDHYPGGMREAIREDKFPVGVFKKGGRGLDDLAHELHGSQHIAEPSEQLLLDMIRSRAPSHSAERQGDHLLAAHELKELNTFKEQHREALRNENPDWTEADIERNVESIVRHGETVAQQEAGAAQRAAERGQTPEPTHAGADDFNFGGEANPAKGPAPSAEVQAPASEAAGWPGSRSAGADIEQSAAGYVAKGMGAMTNMALTPPQQQLAQQSGRRWYAVLHDSLRDFVRKLGGQQFGATARLAPKTADAGVAVAHSKQRAEAQGLLLVEDLFKDTPLHEDLLLGAVWGETELRHRKQQYAEDAATARTNAAGWEQEAKRAGETTGAGRASLSKAAIFNERAKELEDKAAKVGTMIGAADPVYGGSAPLANEADYQQALRNPEVKKKLAEVDRIVSPLTEGDYRRALNLGPNDPLPGSAKKHVPGHPVMSMVALRGEEATGAEKAAGVEVHFDHEISSGSERTNLGRQQQRRLGASREFTGSAKHGYESQLSEIIKRNLIDRAVNADRAEFVRVAEAEGVAKLGGDRPAEDWRPLHKVGKKGETLWVNPRVYSDFRQLLEPAQWAAQLGGSVPGLAAKFTTAQLQSTTDVLSHGKNLLTSAVYGARLRDMWTALRSDILGDRSVRQEHYELTKLGAAGERGFGVPQFEGPVGKFLPSTYVSHALGYMDRAVRVASLRAYDRMLERGFDVPDTAAGRRDFVNQVGNYNKLTQNKLVVLLRDIGIGPFATAATNFWVKSLRTLTLRPGVRAESWASQLQLQGEMLARLAVLPVMAAVTNYLLHKKVEGDEKTPWGAIKLWDDGKGKTNYVDLTNLMGLSRGARETGLKALIESLRPAAKAKGATVGSAVDHAKWDVLHGVTHPFLGPAVAVGKVAATGKDTSGFPKAHMLTADEKKKGESQTVYDFLAALFETNSLAEQWLKPAVQYGETPFGKVGKGLGIKKTPAETQHEPTTGEKAGKFFFGPLGPIPSRKPPGAPIGSR